MNSAEYNERRSKLKVEFDKQLDALAEEYALSNNKIKIGNIIADNLIKIKVDMIKADSLFHEPCCKYYGPVVEPANGKRGSIWQTNVRFIMSYDEDCTSSV